MQSAHDRWRCAELFFLRKPTSGIRTSAISALVPGRLSGLHRIIKADEAYAGQSIPKSILFGPFMKKSLALFPFAAVVGIFALAGCGGSSSVSSASSSGSVNFNGSSTSTGALTTDSTVPASGGATVQTSVNGTLGSAVIPSGAVAGGATVSSTEALAILPINTGFQGSYLSGQQMTVNGVSQSGVGISASGLTEENVALPVAAGTTGLCIRSASRVGR